MNQTQLTTDSIISMLWEGNRRFVAGQAIHPHQTSGRITELQAGQKPLAAILSCSDSRVPPELLFDQGLGDLFVVRSAGHVLDRAVVGSLEYAVAHLHVPLIIVLGHTSCGAVQAALARGEHSGDIGYLVDQIEPAVASAEGAADVAEATTRAHSLRTVEQLREASATWGHCIEIRGALYDLTNGSVTLLSAS